MNYLTLEELKKQCVIDSDFTDDDEFLEMIGDAAEDMAEQLLDMPLYELEAEKARYNFSLYEGRPLTESEVKMFLDKHVEQVKSQWGENNYWTKSAEEAREEKLSKFRHGETIEVASEEYTDSYSNGTGSYARSLLSDGTITNTCYGYLD